VSGDQPTAQLSQLEVPWLQVDSLSCAFAASQSTGGSVTSAGLSVSEDSSLHRRTPGNQTSMHGGQSPPTKA